jgi:hypothetical protein
LLLMRPWALNLDYTTFPFLYFGILNFKRWFENNHECSKDWQVTPKSGVSGDILWYMQAYFPLV